MKKQQSATMNIVNQLFDLAEVPVEKRQAINDAADQFLADNFYIQLKGGAHEAQSPTDAVAFAKWITSRYEYYIKGGTMLWFLAGDSTENAAPTSEIYRLFNPSGEAP